MESVGGGGEWGNNMLQEKLKLHYKRKSIRKRMVKHLGRMYVSLLHGNKCQMLSYSIFLIKFILLNIYT